MAELISIVVPVYNAAPFLDCCLQSIKKQSYPSFEVIMINDGSTDESESMLAAYAKGDSRFLLFNQENHGLGYTRNRGISLSKGKYIYFVDSDDELPKDALQMLMEQMNQHDAEIAVGKVFRFNKERKYIPIRHLEHHLYQTVALTNLIEKPELLQDSIACNKLWKKSFIEANELRFTEGKYYEDLNFTLKAAVLADKIAVTTEPVYYWRVRDEGSASSITQQQMKLRNLADRLDALEQNRVWLEEIEAPNAIAEENHLKSLLDVVRLHAIQYALTDEAERGEWEKRVYAFLEKVPAQVAERLPHKEKILYNMIMSKMFAELDLFSQVFMNEEKSPIVEQIGTKFVIPIGAANFDITGELKPTMIVEALNVDVTCKLEGKLVIPKASKEIQGIVYAIGRKNKQEQQVGRLECVPDTGSGSVYAYEVQRFTYHMNPDDLVGEDTFDFYFKIVGNEDEQKPARIRMVSVLNAKSSVRMNGRSFTFYRTVKGNLSLTIEKSSLLKKVIRFLRK